LYAEKIIALAKNALIKFNIIKGLIFLPDWPECSAKSWQHRVNVAVHCYKDVFVLVFSDNLLSEGRVQTFNKTSTFIYPPPPQNKRSVTNPASQRAFNIVWNENVGVRSKSYGIFRKLLS
jgi:hypothetical protein